jgi:acyl-CoA hydrolase
MTQLVLPQFTNARGALFGGQLVSWIDICGAVAAQRHANAYVVTASIDAVHFLHPVREGQTLVLKGQVNAVFHRSLECGVTAWTEEISGERLRVARAYATFVALGDDDRPLALPPLLLETDDDRRRAAAAAKRREHRLSQRREVSGAGGASS